MPKGSGFFRFWCKKLLTPFSHSLIVNPVDKKTLL
ncbi:hypothetical protein [Klebsiella phage KpF2]|nr:hypothetical protein [Klebsiella phage KpF2]